MHELFHLWLWRQTTHHRWALEAWASRSGSKAVGGSPRRGLGTAGGCHLHNKEPTFSLFPRWVNFINCEKADAVLFLFFHVNITKTSQCCYIILWKCNNFYLLTRNKHDQKLAINYIDHLFADIKYFDDWHTKFSNQCYLCCIALQPCIV